jgi:hypothetical protein
VDTATEVEVFLNGTRLGFLDPTPNNGTGPSTFQIAAADQLSGDNIIEFHAANPAWAWGVTDVLIDEMSIV